MLLQRRKKTLSLLTLLSFILMALLIFNLIGCTNVEIKDQEWFGSLGPLGAVSMHTLTNESDVLAYSDWVAKWDNATDPMICISSTGFAELKKEQELLCMYSNDCTYEVRQQIDAFYSKVTNTMKQGLVP